MERGLVRQHRDVWAGIIRRDKLTDEGLGGGSGVLVGRLLASMQEEDKARPLLEGMAGPKMNSATAVAYPNPKVL